MRLRNWSFTNKKATKTLKYPVANLCASKCLNSTLSVGYCFLSTRRWRDPMVIHDNSQALFSSIKIYKKHLTGQYLNSSYKSESYGGHIILKYISDANTKRILHQVDREILPVELIRPYSSRNDSTSLKTSPAILPRTIPCML